MSQAINSNLKSTNTTKNEKKSIFKIIQVSQLLNQLETSVLIDVRSPLEFQEDHIPGAVNLPVLDDEERRQIGTLYKANSFAARHEGAVLISANIAKKILPQIKQISVSADSFEFSQSSSFHKPNTQFVIYCWRGGMRSSSLSSVIDMIGYHTSRLDGGYRSFRRLVQKTLYGGSGDDTTCSIEQLRCISIHGPSGSGKTELLTELRNSGNSILFLEQYANHKGSLLGGDFTTQPSQKWFETLLWNDLRLQNLFNTDLKLCFVEGESRKIGRLTLPTCFYDRMKAGSRIWVELPIEERARRLAFEYSENDEVLLKRLNRMKAYFSKPVFQEIIDSINKGERYRASYLLLAEHYDRYYKRNSPEITGNYLAVFREPTFALLKDRLLHWVNQNTQ
ncbi:MAG: tRNA 2-selenouridine(34) synthase MnmH [Leptonema sp. (in: Bacteria)]|nr:tRNA 2-selenouridine(34) synthase MnmH [Leptonema sp. (in: bacteria)]